MRRFYVVAAAVVIFASGAVVGRSASRFEEPPAGPPRIDVFENTVPIEEQKLVKSASFSGTVELSSEAGRVTAVGFVTGLPLEAGEIVSAWSPIIEVNGRPIIALPLPFPLWRDLEPNMKGKDVLELQRALIEAKRLESRASGQIDKNTQNALAQIYVEAGYPEPDSGVLPMGETVSVGVDPSRLDLAGLDIGSRFDDESQFHLAGTQASIVIADDGELAKKLAQSAGAAIRLAGQGGDDLSAVLVRATSGSESTLVVRGDNLPAAGQVAGSIDLDSTDGNVLSVPANAVSIDARGNSQIEVVGETGARQSLNVTVGFVGDRLVEIRAPGLSPGTLVSLRGA